MQIPVLPSELTIPSSSMNNETFNGVNGELRLIGQRNLRTIKINSFFPDKKYEFDKTGFAYGAQEHVDVLERWIARRVPIRIVIPARKINMAVTIDKFEHTQKKGSNIYYTLEMTEFIFPKAKVSKATGKIVPTVPKFEKYVAPPKEDSSKSSSSSSKSKGKPGKGYDSKQAKAVRDKVNALGLRISSAGRSAQHNAEVGGSKTSAHITNEAYDVTGSNKKLDELAAWGRKNGYFVLWKTKGHYDHCHLDWKKR